MLGASQATPSETKSEEEKSDRSRFWLYFFVFLDCVYGFIMMLAHAVLLGETGDDNRVNSKDWFIQLLDLDIGFMKLDFLGGEGVFYYVAGGLYGSIIGIVSVGAAFSLLHHEGSESKVYKLKAMVLFKTSLYVQMFVYFLNQCVKLHLILHSDHGVRYYPILYAGAATNPGPLVFGYLQRFFFGLWLSGIGVVTVSGYYAEPEKKSKSSAALLAGNSSSTASGQQFQYQMLPHAGMTSAASYAPFNPQYSFMPGGLAGGANYAGAASYMSAPSMAPNAVMPAAQVKQQTSVSGESYSPSNVPMRQPLYAYN